MWLLEHMLEYYYMPPFKLQTPYRDVVIIGMLIGGVCFLALTPAMYLAFHALQWERALRIVEIAFFPALFLSVAAGLFAYQRARIRRTLWDDDAFHEKRSG
jgi:hypothetical protein